ncbi:hypothetical protein JW859_05845 [bacterium]|nr:hypothetical protein [bacterium]
MKLITDYREYNKMTDRGFFGATSLLFEWAEKTTIPARTLNLTATFKSHVEDNLVLVVKFFGVCALEHVSPFDAATTQNFMAIEAIRDRQMENINYRAFDIEDHGECVEFFFDTFYAVIED